MSRAGSPLVPRPIERFDARLSPLFVQRPFNRLGVEFDYPTAGPATAWNRSSGLMTDADMNFSRYLLPMTALAMLRRGQRCPRHPRSGNTATPLSNAPAKATFARRFSRSGLVSGGQQFSNREAIDDA